MQRVVGRLSPGVSDKRWARVPAPIVNELGLSTRQN